MNRSLTPTARKIRGVLTAAVIAAMFAGTFWGDDDNFPFGPYRMYSTTNSLDGHVDAPEVWGVTESGEEFMVQWEWMGLRRAEIEGQIRRFEKDPDALRYVAEAYEKFHPEGEDLVAVKLREEVQILEDGRPKGEPLIVLLAQWDAE